jgi:cytochrome b561
MALPIALRQQIKRNKNQYHSRATVQIFAWAPALAADFHSATCSNPAPTSAPRSTRQPDLPHSIPPSFHDLIRMTIPDSHYDRHSIRLHWITAALVAALWLLGQTIDWFPRGSPRVAARSTHILLGVTLAVVLAMRIRWRFSGGIRLPPAGAGALLDALAGLTHKALYVLLVGTVVLGIATAWIRGDSLFGLLTIPSPVPGNRDVRKTFEDLHGLAANVLLGLAFVHAAAGLFHHLVLKDRVLQRMLPKRERR